MGPTEIDLSAFGRGKLAVISVMLVSCAAFFGLITVTVLVFEPWWAASVPAFGTLFFGYFALNSVLETRKRFSRHGFVLNSLGISWFTQDFRSSPIGWNELYLARVVFHIHIRTGLPSNHFLELYPRDPRSFAVHHPELSTYYGHGLSGLTPATVVPYRFRLPPAQQVVAVLERAICDRAPHAWGGQVPSQ